MVFVSSEQLLASLPEEEIFFYYDELMKHIPESERYASQGIYLQIDPNLLFFDWKYTTDICSPMELKLINNRQHLAIIFNDNAGISLHFSYIHIIDLETFEEIPVELLIKNLENHWIVHEFNHNTSFIQFEGFGKKFSLNVSPILFTNHLPDMRLLMIL